MSNDRTQGQSSVTIGFRCLPHAGWDRDTLERGLRHLMGDWARQHTQTFAGLEVDIQAIGTQPQEPPP